MSVEVRKRTIERLQYPITPAYAFTNYCSQGQTIPAVIVDIATPPTGSGLSLANIYVALLRSLGRKTIRILREFDESIFAKPVDYDLVKEDERQEKLNEQTKTWWGKLRS
jgi:ATP-dependent exoDNAse (exonuclease V) alpha subunit